MSGDFGIWNFHIQIVDICSSVENLVMHKYQRERGSDPLPYKRSARDQRGRSKWNGCGLYQCLKWCYIVHASFAFGFWAAQIWAKWDPGWGAECTTEWNTNGHRREKWCVIRWQNIPTCSNTGWYMYNCAVIHHILYKIEAEISPDS